ncbi:hypothetical protein BJY04DRAFT_71922 [Aspergillus karnatakaensis]|uniref:uncharacterized protein n=1 Tax=Aspergillus karnatakaensis TaxID=1810916 RepID=UPI003CCDC276
MGNFFSRASQQPAPPPSESNPRKRSAPSSPDLEPPPKRLSPVPSDYIIDPALSEPTRSIAHWLAYGVPTPAPPITPKEQFYAPYLARRVATTRAQLGLPPIDTEEWSQSSLDSVSLPRDEKDGYNPTGNTDPRKEKKTIHYTDPIFPSILTSHFYTFSTTIGPGPAQTELDTIKLLLDKKYTTPTGKGNPFRNQAHTESTLAALKGKPKTAIIRAIGELLVPSASSAECTEEFGPNWLQTSVAEQWTHSISLLQGLPPFKQPRDSEYVYVLPTPCPEYSVGFNRNKFSAEQKKKIDPFFGWARDQSFFLGTSEMAFPFLVSEVVSDRNAGNFLAAERASAQYMAVAMRGVVYLFTLGGRARELDGRVLGWSVEHDCGLVRVFAHYVEVGGDENSAVGSGGAGLGLGIGMGMGKGKGKGPAGGPGGPDAAEKVYYYRHLVMSETIDGKNRFDCWRFVMAVYREWVPGHWAFIKGAVDDIGRGWVGEEGDGVETVRLG